MPEISVIIPNYNHSAYLKQRIESVLNQTYPDFEVIILDDCSSDNSREIIELYRNHPKVSRIIYNQKNSGSPFSQWESGINQSKGDYVWIAESDDFSELTFLETMIRLISQYENTGIGFCNSYWVDDNGKKGTDLSLYHQSFIRSGLDEIKNTLLRYCSIQNVSSCIIKRSLAARAVKGLDRYRACGDWIFYVRLLQEADLAYCEDKLNYFRWYHNNISNSASSEGRWVYEGINILLYVDFAVIKLSIREYVRLTRFWFGKASVLRWSQRLYCYKVLCKTSYHYTYKRLFGPKEINL